MDPGGRHTKMFLKSYNSAHTCRIEKRFSVLCSSSDALSNDTSLTQKMKKRNNFPSFGDVSQCDVTSCQFQDTYTCCYCSRSCLPNKETCARTPGRSNRSAKVTGMTSDQMASRLCDWENENENVSTTSETFQHICPVSFIFSTCSILH